MGDEGEAVRGWIRVWGEGLGEGEKWMMRFGLGLNEGGEAMREVEVGR